MEVPPQNTGRAVALSCGVLALVAISIIGLALAAGAAVWLLAR